MKLQKIGLLGFLLCFLTFGHAQQRDSLRFSLLTCAPGPVVYELFGHTAIRYQNFTRSTDIVFNYGMFDFDTPNFSYRFAKGQADYQLGINSIEGFRRSYARRSSSVYEQELNLTADEKLRLQQALFVNYQPENRVYRYNYFYNNCTTCARDQIERCINGKIIYPEGQAGKSFRSVIHEYTLRSPWDELGIDLLLGAEADEEIGVREQMFAPFYLRDFFAEAVVVTPGGEKRSLVTRETKIVDVYPQPLEPGFFLSPMACSIIFMVINLLIAFLQVKKQQIFWGWDILLYGAQGIAGCVIAFLFFFSTHPTVGSNWLLMLLHPVALLFIPWTIWGRKKYKKDYFSWVNVIALTFFIISFCFLPQEFNLTILPLALGLLASAASHVAVTRK